MILRSLLLIVLLAAPLTGCSDLGAECDAAGPPTPGATCKDDDLQCGYFPTQSNCDGTPIVTSCTCNEGIWSCPTLPVCDDGGGDGP